VRGKLTGQLANQPIGKKRASSHILVSVQTETAYPNSLGLPRWYCAKKVPWTAPEKQETGK